MTNSHDIPYYLQLQQRLLSIFPYVSCHQDNYNTYSIQFESLLVDACSFFDSMCQEFIRERHPKAAFSEMSRVRDHADKLAGTKYFKMDDYRILFEKEFGCSRLAVNVNVDEDHWYFNPLAAVRQLTHCLITPFDGWQFDRGLDWWSAYTSLKHNRLLNRKRATLKSALYSMGAVFVILTHRQASLFMSGQVGREVYQLFVPQYWEHTGTVSVGVPIWAKAK